MPHVQLSENLTAVLQHNTVMVLAVASEVTGSELSTNISRQDRLRLLNLVTWSDRYSLPLSEILDILLAIWKKKFTSGRKGGLGVTIATLTGVKSHEIIRDYVRKKYTNRENLVLVKQQLREHMLPATPACSMEDPMSFGIDYRKFISSLREQDTGLADKFKRRRWRTNPFV